MMTHLESSHTLPATRPLRTVAVVSRDPHHVLLEGVLGAVEHDVVFVESVACAYSHIKRVSPDLVIACLSSDDVGGCQVLSMLTLDRETSRIPVVTCLHASSDRFDYDGADHNEDVVNQAVPISVN